MIREVTISDIPKLLHLFDLNCPAYFDPAERGLYEHYLLTKREEYFIVEIENDIVAGGGIHFLPEERLVKLAWDLVHPEFQRKGFGSAILHHRLMKIKNDERFTYAVVRTSQHAYLFYLKAGFQIKHIKPDFWAKGFDLYHMQLSLR